MASHSTTERPEPTDHAPPPTPRVRAGDDRLTPLDASFLYLERPTELLHVGAVAVLESTPPFDELVATLGERLGALERYRQVPVRSTLDVAAPRWQADPAFDARRHFHRLAVPAPGDEAALRRALQEIFARPLPSDRPLWECWFLEGLAGGRAALLTKVHHCMVDGVSGVQVLEVMADGWETRLGAAPPALADVPEPVRQLRGVAASVGRMLDAVAHPRRAVEGVRAAASAAGAVLDVVGRRLVPFPFNGPLGEERRIAWATFDLDEFLAIRGAAGCKVNDVALAVIAGALRRLLPVEATQPPRRVRALIPVNVRRDDEHLRLGNRVSGMFAALPVDVADARERLRIVAAEMRANKEAGQGQVFDLALGIAGIVPSVLAPMLSRLPQWWPVAHTVCTNVPGPREPRRLLGRRVLEVHPLVPLAAGIGLGFAILSYAGTISIAATADASLVPDVDRLPTALRVSADELALHLGVRDAAKHPHPPYGGAVTVGDLMTRDVVSIRTAELLANAWRTMRERRIRHLPVVDRHKALVGLVTHRDLLAASPSSLALHDERERVRGLGWATAAEIMESHVSTAAADESAADVAIRMVRQKIGCLPVVDARGALVGIVTEEDFLRWSATLLAGYGRPADPTEIGDQR
ncbi:MAG: wax ester/triacylglycerol synthase family O-acyltransferase [Deltaproteobacteria bacterium]|nr:wax ester/triacylglycerol synthase family O-acyltransferase [Deltaproteobacteria bacterium]